VRRRAPDLHRPQFGFFKSASSSPTVTSLYPRMRTMAMISGKASAVCQPARTDSLRLLTEKRLIESLVCTIDSSMIGAGRSPASNQRQTTEVV